MNATLRSVTFASLLVACQATEPADEPAPLARAASVAPVQAAPAENGAAKQPKKKVKSEAEKAYEEADRAHSLSQARMDMEITQLDVTAARTKAELGVTNARRELEEKERALAVFLEHERPNKMANAQLSLDRVVHRLDLERDELNELTAMYEAEDFAELTKELVLKRGRMGVAFAERSLELERKKLDLLSNETLAKQERELRVGVEKAQHGVREAEIGLKKAELEADKKLSGARHAIEKLERPVPDEDGDE